MAKLVEYSEIDNARPRTVAVSATAVLLSDTRLGLTRRKSIFITPTTGSLVVTIVKCDDKSQVVAGSGYVIITNQPYAENDDINSDCWQGRYYVIANGAGNIAVTEVFESPGKI